MIMIVDELFNDSEVVEKIKQKLPRLFQIAELESSRAGKIGMEVGVVRERVIVALLIHKYGEENVTTEIPTTEPEVDAMILGSPLSIKTITGTKFGGIKLIWTVDAAKAIEFRENYQPKCDILLVQINWGGDGGFYYIPLDVQESLFNKIGRERYIKLPKPGTNPRGVEFDKDALSALVNDPSTKKIPIRWQKQKIEFNPFKRWVELWESS